MPTLNQIFDKRNILLYHNESLDLDHYYQEPYQDEGDEIKEMGELKTGPLLEINGGKNELFVIERFTSATDFSDYRVIKGKF